MTCDFLVVMAGTVTRTFPIPGISEEAFSLLHVAEGPFAIRDRVPTSFDRGGGESGGPERRKLLTATFVGGGSPEWRVSVNCSSRPPPCGRCLQIDSDELAFHLVEAPAASCQGPLTDLAPG